MADLELVREIAGKSGVYVVRKHILLLLADAIQSDPFLLLVISARFRCDRDTGYFFTSLFLRMLRFSVHRTSISSSVTRTISLNKDETGPSHVARLRKHISCPLWYCGQFEDIEDDLGAINSCKLSRLSHSSLEYFYRLCSKFKTA